MAMSILYLPFILYKPNGLVPPTCKFRHRFVFLVDLVVSCSVSTATLKIWGKSACPIK